MEACQKVQICIYDAADSVARMQCDNGGARWRNATAGVMTLPWTLPAEEKVWNMVQIRVRDAAAPAAGVQTFSARIGYDASGAAGARIANVRTYCERRRGGGVECVG